MEHHFNVEIAKMIGVNAAIIYNNIKFWCAKNKANDKHFHKGQYWTYNSKSALQELFPYLTYSQIKSALNILFEKGFIGKDNFNSNPYDRTNWYCDLGEKQALIDIQSTGDTTPMERIPVANQLATQRQCITDINTDSKPYTSTTEEVEEESPSIRIIGFYENIDDAITEMKKSIQWKTAMCKQTGVGSLEDGDRWIDLFKDHTVASGTTVFKLKDLQHHCFSWVRKRIEAGAKLPIPKEEHKPWKVNLSNMQFH